MSSLTPDRGFEGLEVVGFVVEKELEVRDWVEGERISVREWVEV